MEPKHVYTTGEIANLLHMHQTTVIDWAKKRMVKSYRTPGGHRRISHDDLIAFLREHRMPIPAELVPRVKSSEKPLLHEHRRPHKPQR